MSGHTQTDLWARGMSSSSAVFPIQGGIPHEQAAVEDGMGQSSVYLAPQQQIHLLEQMYHFEDPRGVRFFLLRNPDLIEVLLTADEEIRSVFGEAELSLKVHIDPEEGWEQLILVIRSSHGPEEAVELETLLFERWFISLPGKVKSRMTFIQEGDGI